MKKWLFLAMLLGMNYLISYTQPSSYPCGPLTSGPAPAFRATSTKGEIVFPDDYFGKWKILFSHPADFTPVCTSEILALAASQDEFQGLNTQILVLSTDGLSSHIAWVKSMEDMAYQGLPGHITENPNRAIKIDFPLIADTDLAISRGYGLLQADPGAKRDIRGVVFIDPENNIKAFFHYPANVGRNIAEIKRTLLALQMEDRHDVLLPVDWHPGSEVLIHSPSSMKEAEKLDNSKRTDLRRASWYMWYKKM